MGQSAEAHGFNIDGTRIEIEKKMGTNPRRVIEIDIDIYFPEGSGYSDKEKRFIEAAVNGCPVSNSLNPEIVKNIVYHYWKDFEAALLRMQPPQSVYYQQFIQPYLKIAVDFKVLKTLWNPQSFYFNLPQYTNFKHYSSDSSFSQCVLSYDKFLT